MYKIQNIALDGLLQEYNVSSLHELSDDQLLEITLDKRWLDLNLRPVYLVDKNTGILGDFDHIGTINYILSANTYSEYMDKSYWSLDNKKRADGYRLLERIGETMDGKQTFKIFAEAKMGFHELAPGDSVELDVTSRWVEESLKTKPMARNLLIEKIGEPKLQVQSPPIEKKPEPKEQGLTELKSSLKEQEQQDAKTIYQNMSDTQLRNLARRKGIKIGGKTTEEIILEMVAQVNG